MGIMKKATKFVVLYTALTFGAGYITATKGCSYIKGAAVEGLESAKTLVEKIPTTQGDRINDYIRNFPQKTPDQMYKK